MDVKVHLCVTCRSNWFESSIGYYERFTMTYKGKHSIGLYTKKWYFTYHRVCDAFPRRSYSLFPMLKVQKYSKVHYMTVGRFNLVMFK